MYKIFLYFSRKTISLIVYCNHQIQILKFQLLFNPYLNWKKSIYYLRMTTLKRRIRKIIPLVKNMLRLHLNSYKFSSIAIPAPLLIDFYFVLISFNVSNFIFLPSIIRRKDLTTGTSLLRI